VYVIGEEVFGMRTRGPSRDAPRWACPISRDVREIALRCGRLFDLRLYGLDIVESADGPLVVDLNYFPSYRNVPHAAVLIADFIDAYARGPVSARVPARMTRIGRAIAAHHRGRMARCTTVKRSGWRSSGSATRRHRWCRASSSIRPP